MANASTEPDDPFLARARARVGSVLQERWTLVRLLGLGGAAAVYEARHRNGKRAAVKVLHAIYSGDDQMRERFLREGYVANKVGHPGVVSVLDDGVDATGSAFLVMDLLEGASLEDHRERAGGTLPAGEVLSVIASVLDVLVVAHGAGIVHRDLKPENLFRTLSGEIKVLDFGIARLLERSSSATATSSHASMGTPAFMPPEQASARWSEVDARSDIWAVGATALILATGLFVHDGTTAMEVLAKAIMYPARPTRERAPDVPAPLAEVIDRALAFDKAHRYPSAAAMLEAVRAAQGALNATGAAGSVSRSAPSLPVPLASAATVLGTGPATFLARPSTEMPAPRPEPMRTEIAIVSSHAAARSDVRATAQDRSAPKKSHALGIVIGLFVFFGVAAAAALGISRSMHKSLGGAGSSDVITAAPTRETPNRGAADEAASTPTVSPAPTVSESAETPAPPAASAEPAAPAQSAHAPVAAGSAPSPAHSGRRPPSPSSSSPPAGVGPLTEQL